MGKTYRHGREAKCIKYGVLVCVACGDSCPDDNKIPCKGCEVQK